MMIEWEIHPLCPQDFPSSLRISLGHRGWLSQYLPRFDGARIQYDRVSDVLESNVQFASKILTPNRMD